MASNPIKRRSRQSFFLGFLIALVIMAVVVMLLFTKINSLNEENEKLKVVGPKVSVYTVNRDIEEGEAITVDDLEAASMQLTASSTAIDVENYIDPTIFYTTDEETGEETEVSYTSKVKIPAGTVVTLSMLSEGGIANDERLVEYGMIVLPTELINGDYIDVRLRLANGTETVVLPKKKVDHCTDTTVWLKVNEDEILTMNSAIVDAYTATGAQLRATKYTNPLMQEAAKQTYPVNNDVLTAISNNPNILNEAKSALIERWSQKSDASSDSSDFVISRRLINGYETDDANTTSQNVKAGYDAEASSISTARSQYVTSLDGTGLVGAPEQGQ